MQFKGNIVHIFEHQIYAFGISAIIVINAIALGLEASVYFKEAKS